MGAGSGGIGDAQSPSNRAREILEERFVRGELDKDEFEERRRLLSKWCRLPRRWTSGDGHAVVRTARKRGHGRVFCQVSRSRCGRVRPAAIPGWGLETIYSKPAVAVRAAPPMADWIRAHVDHPPLVQPDSESVQWVAAVAGQAQARTSCSRKHAVEVASWRYRCPGSSAGAGNRIEVSAPIANAVRRLLDGDS